MQHIFSKNQLKAIKREIQTGFLATGLNGNIHQNELDAMLPTIVFGVVLALIATDKHDIVMIAEHHTVYSRRALLACMRVIIDGEISAAIGQLQNSFANKHLEKTHAQIREDMVVFCKHVALYPKK